MSVVTDTTNHENGVGITAGTGLIAGAGNWIPAYAGMTVGGLPAAIFRVMTHEGR